MKKTVIAIVKIVKYLWKCIFTESKDFDKKDNIKLAKELIFRDNTPKEIIFIFKELEKEIKEHLHKAEQKNELENKAISLYFNPIVNSFKNRPQEVKDKYNYLFENIN